MKIKEILHGSIGEELGLAVGQNLIEIDNIKNPDFLDYEYFNGQENFVVAIDDGEEIVEYEIEKYPSEDLGLVFEEDTGCIRCKNKCIFCFVDQLPSSSQLGSDNQLSSSSQLGANTLSSSSQLGSDTLSSSSQLGSDTLAQSSEQSLSQKKLDCTSSSAARDLRQTLRVKDDDYRLSFLLGNYVTLTNIKASDMKRIVKYQLSPLYISVHSTDKSVRNLMLGNRAAPDIMQQIRFLHENGIELHTQIVYCPTFNDDVAQTIDDLAPFAKTLAIVPVGLTRHSNPKLVKVDKSSADKVIDIVSAKNAEYSGKLASIRQGNSDKWLFCSDEFYCIANRETPEVAAYGDFEQIGNGVGMVTRFVAEVRAAVASITGEFKLPRWRLVTGTSAYPIIAKCAKMVTDKWGGEVEVKPITNNFFGSTVTVAGLVVASDILAQFGECDCDKVMLPKCMLKEYDNHFLDDITVEELSERLGKPLVVVDTDGETFVNALLGIR